MLFLSNSLQYIPRYKLHGYAKLTSLWNRYSLATKPLIVYISNVDISYQNVVQLQIPVHDAQLVHVFKTFGDFHGPLNSFHKVVWPLRFPWDFLWIVANIITQAVLTKLRHSVTFFNAAPKNLTMQGWFNFLRGKCLIKYRFLFWQLLTIASFLKSNKNKKNEQKHLAN